MRFSFFMHVFIFYGMRCRGILLNLCFLFQFFLLLLAHLLWIFWDIFFLVFFIRNFLNQFTFSLFLFRNNFFEDLFFNRNLLINLCIFEDFLIYKFDLFPNFIKNLTFFNIFKFFILNSRNFGQFFLLSFLLIFLFVLLFAFHQLFVNLSGKFLFTPFFELLVQKQGSCIKYFLVATF